MADKKEVLRLMDLAYQARQNLCKMCCSYSGNVHMGGDMSMMEVLTTLFHHTMNVRETRKGTDLFFQKDMELSACIL